jgi:hypothetical protein
MNFNRIKKAILKNRVLAFLGHGVTINYGGEDKEKIFLEELFEENKGEIISYNIEDKFLIFNSESAKNSIRLDMVDFYDEDFSNEITTKLSELPIHTYVCLSPDPSLIKTFEKQNFPFVHTHWNDVFEGDVSFTKENPLIYHLFGTSKDIESLIISHYDLFEYIKHMHANGNKKLKEVFADTLDRYDYILFLGCDFDKWYFQLVLNLLRIGFDYNAYKGVAVNPQKTKNTWGDVYEQYFKVEFVEGNQINDFVNKLHEEFEPNELRKPSEKRIIQNFNKQNIYNLFFEGFDDESLRLFCQLDNDFDKVYDNFAAGQTKSERIEKLIDYAKRYLLIDKLLRLAAQQNPAMYEQHKPYEDE